MSHYFQILQSFYNLDTLFPIFILSAAYPDGSDVLSSGYLPGFVVGRV